MRATSTFREGPDGNYLATADPKGDTEEKSNRDNFRIPGGQTHVLMDVEGPGVITHMWLTFLGPEAHPWAKDGRVERPEIPCQKCPVKAKVVIGFIFENVGLPQAS